MRISVWRPACLLALAAILTSGAHAQQDSETVKQFWPEVDVYVPLNEKFRLFFLATTTKAEETRNGAIERWEVSCRVLSAFLCDLCASATSALKFVVRKI
jgi:hypothetical protein